MNTNINEISNRGFSLNTAILCSIFSIIFNIINDCDETFNYLEPANFLVRGEKSFQTWEYSPEFALRSYLYLFIFSFPSFIVQRMIKLDGIYLFLLIRLSLVILNFIALAYFTKCLSSLPSFTLKTFQLPVNLNLILTFTYILTPSYFITVSSFVPSAVSSAMTLLHLGAFINGNDFIAVGSIAFSAIICWPFTAIIGLPYFICSLKAGKLRPLFLYSTFFATLFITPQFVVDSFFYGKLVSPTLNIIKYNVFGSIFYNGTSSELYGTEPTSYYIKNLFLNFNLVFALFLFSLPWFAVSYFSNGINRLNPITSIFLKSYSIIFLWFLTFFYQAHKEERFLFPVYPIISFCAAILLFDLCFRLSSLFSKSVKEYHQLIMILLLLIIFSSTFIIGLSRIIVLIKGYSAPIYLVRHLPKCEKSSPVLCIGRDWHYFPTRMLIPYNNYDVRFIKSSFMGQLPAIFSSSSIIESTRTNGGAFNLMNQEEPDRYVAISSCDVVLDRLTSVREREIDFSTHPNWSVYLSHRIIEAKSSGILEMISRAFFIPEIIIPSQNHFVNMTIFINSNFYGKCN